MPLCPSFRAASSTLMVYLVGQVAGAGNGSLWQLVNLEQILVFADITHYEEAVARSALQTTDAFFALSAQQHGHVLVRVILEDQSVLAAVYASCLLHAETAALNGLLDDLHSKEGYFLDIEGKHLALGGYANPVNAVHRITPLEDQQFRCLLLKGEQDLVAAQRHHIDRWTAVSHQIRILDPKHCYRLITVLQSNLRLRLVLYLELQLVQEENGSFACALLSWQSAPVVASCVVPLIISVHTKRLHLADLGRLDLQLILQSLLAVQSEELAMNAVEDVRCEGSNYEFLAADNNLVRLLGHGVICQYLVSAFAHHKPVLVETCGHSLLELDIGSWKQGRQLPSLQLDHT